VHGESIVERVPAGTNRAALDSGEIDVLAHPGLLEEADARLARDHDVFLEISARRGHSLTNGLVVARARAAGAALVVDSDAHAPEQLVPPERARAIALGAGVPEAEADAVLLRNPARLLRRCGGG